MSDDSLLPEFNVRLAFVNEDGNEIPKEEFSRGYFEGQQFFKKWAEGKIRRDVVIDLGQGVTSEDLHGEITKKFLTSSMGEVTVANHFSKLLAPLLSDLSLASRLLGRKTFDEDELPAIIRLTGSADLPKPWDGAVFDPGTRRSGMEYPIYPCFYPNDSEQEGIFLLKEFERPRLNFVEFLRDHFRKVLSILATKDNETIIKLLRTAAAHEDATLTSADLSTTAFTHARNIIWRWKLPVTALVTDAASLAGASDLLTSDWFAPAAHLDNFLQGSVGKLLDATVLCLGAPNDPLQIGFQTKEVLLCTAPSKLGLRGVFQPLVGFPMDRRVLEEQSIGFYYFEQIYTVVLNSKGVSRLTVI